MGATTVAACTACHPPCLCLERSASPRSAARPAGRHHPRLRARPGRPALSAGRDHVTELLHLCNRVNRIHNILCSSNWWAGRVEDKLIPWGLRGVELGDDVLEIGPGFGATTRVLAGGPSKLTALELEPRYCERLRRDLGDRIDVVHGDATQLPFDEGRFSAVICFTMLHHIPQRSEQDRVFAEVARVLRDGGTFAGTDSVGTGAVFRLIHIGDTLLPIEPDELPVRLDAAGLVGVEVRRVEGTFRFRARKPA